MYLVKQKNAIKPIIFVKNINALNQGISADCDCACSMPLPQNNKFESDFLSLRNLAIDSELKTVELDQDFRVCFNPTFNTIATINTVAFEILNTFVNKVDTQTALNSLYARYDIITVDKTIQSFLELGFLSSDEPKLMAFDNLQRKDLSVWLHITDGCNMKCTYCFLPHEKKNLSSSVGLSAIKAVFRTAKEHGYRKIKFKYAGGEPLIQFDSIVNLHEYSQKLSKNYGIDIEGVLLSNGTLFNNSILHKVNSLGLDIMISLDGFGSYQEKQRPIVGKKGSFTLVQNSLFQMQQLGITPSISITVTPMNAEGLPKLVRWLLNRNLPFSINFARANDFYDNADHLHLHEELIIQNMKQVIEILKGHLSQKNFLASLLDRGDLSCTHTKSCEAGISYFAIDCNGGISKCHMEINNPITTVFDSNPFELVHKSIQGVQNLSVLDKQGCQNCEWKFWCAGGCPIHTYRVTGRYDIQSPNCHIYKTLFPELIKLEGQRLKKYGVQAPTSHHPTNRLLPTH